jgi:outer membrane protein OmpA-like peptidoglycan-associated protein
MAEIMLLLVFCLLLAAGATLRHERIQRERAEAEVATFKQKSQINDALNAALLAAAAKYSRVADALGAASEANINEFWTELVEGRAVARELAKHGIVLKDIKDSTNLIADAKELREQGINLDAMKETASLVDGIRELQRANGMKATHVQDTLKALERGIKAGEAKPDDSKEHKWPPMIRLSEAGGYYFAIGSAELTPEFERRLRDIVVPLLVERAREYNVDVIEVVGHTDELPLGAKTSNLDRDLTVVLRGDKPIVTLRPGDNAGLGLARSVSVVRNLLRDPRLEGLRILPFSAAQLIRTEERLANGMEDQGDVKERRRIEIRLRKST